jgi:SOS-response transcriptional repressor LexA
MTKNEENLLKFISRYRRENRMSPTLREMVSGIGVFDNKSVLLIINNLIEKDYLTKKEGKARSVQLTCKADKFLFDFLNPKQHTFGPFPADQLKQPAELERNGVEASYPTKGELKYTQGGIAADSTEVDKSLEMIVESAVNTALETYARHNFQSTHTNTGFAHNLTNLLTRLIDSEKFLTKIEWVFVAFLSLGGSSIFLKNSYFSIAATVVIFALVFVSYNISKE